MSLIRPALVLLAFFTVLTGVLYPVAVTAIAQTAFPARANGSLILQGDEVVGSDLIGQSFTSPKYFWSRPSATSPAYNGGASSGSNQGPLNPALKEAVEGRIKALRDADPGNTAPIPVDLVTASGSGLDPHISPAAAAYQVSRVAKARGMDPTHLYGIVEQHVEGRTLGVLGEPRVNVLRLNLALDAMSAR